MILSYVAKQYHEYKRLKIELDLIDSELTPTYPVLNVITRYLRNPPYDTNTLEKDLKEYYGTLQPKDNSDNT